MAEVGLKEMEDIEFDAVARLRCSIGGDVLIIGIQLCAKDGERLHCRLNIEVLTPEVQRIVTVPVSFFGYELTTSIHELQQLYANLSGTVILHDCDSVEIACFTADNRRRGHVAVGVHVALYTFGGEPLSSAHFLDAPGLIIALEGVQTDQSCLAPFISELSAIVTTAGGDFRNPYPPSIMFE